MIRALYGICAALLYVSGAAVCTAAAPQDTLKVEEKRDSIAEAKITADKYAGEVARSQTGHTRLEEADFIYGNVVFSSPDLIKTLQNLPGVSSGTELMSGLYVHGGEGSDNLFLLDGVPMYQISHLGGLFSSFNTDIVRHLDFYKSGFPARYGGRMSSVVDIATRDGDFEKYRGTFMIGLIDGRLQFEGPIIKGKTSFNLAFRRSWMDAVLAPVISIVNRRNKDGETIGGTYSFYDMNASLTHKFSEDNILSLRFYHGRDHLKLKLDTQQSESVYEDGEYITVSGTDNLHTDISWGNTLASLNWRYRILDNLKMKSVLYYTGSNADVQYWWHSWEYDKTELNNSMDETNYSRVNDIAWNTDFSWRPLKSHHVRFGASYQFHIFDPSRHSTVTSGTARDESSSSRHYTGNEFALYAEDGITLLDRLSVDLGLRNEPVRPSGIDHIPGHPHELLAPVHTGNRADAFQAGGRWDILHPSAQFQAERRRMVQDHGQPYRIFRRECALPPARHMGDIFQQRERPLLRS